MKRNPYLAAVLNALLYGLGYVYLGKRMLFGVLLIFSCIFAIAFFVAKPESIFNPLIISIVLSCVAFAYDAFKEAKGPVEKEY